MRSGLLCSVVSTRDKSIVRTNWNWLVDVWCGLGFGQSIFKRILTSGKEDFELILCRCWRRILLATTCELTMLISSISVIFSVTYLSVEFLITTRSVPMSRAHPDQFCLLTIQFKPVCWQWHPAAAICMWGSVQVLWQRTSFRHDNTSNTVVYHQRMHVSLHRVSQLHRQDINITSLSPDSLGERDVMLDFSIHLVGVICLQQWKLCSSGKGFSFLTHITIWSWQSHYDIWLTLFYLLNYYT